MQLPSSLLLHSDFWGVQSLLVSLPPRKCPCLRALAEEEKADVPWGVLPLPSDSGQWMVCLRLPGGCGYGGPKISEDCFQWLAPLFYSSIFPLRHLGFSFSKTQNLLLSGPLLLYPGEAIMLLETEKCLGHRTSEFMFSFQLCDLPQIIQPF